MAKDNRKFRVLSSGLTTAGGELRREGEILTGEEIGNVDVHIERSAIEMVADTAKLEPPKAANQKPEAKN